MSPRVKDLLTGLSDGEWLNVEGACTGRPRGLGSAHGGQWPRGVRTRSGSLGCCEWGAAVGQGGGRVAAEPGVGAAAHGRQRRRAANPESDALGGSLSPAAAAFRG